jgi:tetratricopeptide (TPR) repeat protein
MKHFVADACDTGCIDIATASTSDFCRKYVRPQTKPFKCSLVDKYKRRSGKKAVSSFTGRASVFVSHAWRYKITEVLDVMEQYEAAHPGTYFWFDTVINNQNAGTEYPLEWWSTTFRESIRQIGAVLLVLSPWNDPLPITRAWCLWEIMCALDQPGVKLEVILPAAEAKALKAGVVEDPRSIMKALAHIRAEKAEANRKTDRTMIFTAIEKSVGFNTVNERVKAQLRAWYVKLLRSIVDEERAAPQPSPTVLSQMAMALSELAQYDYALDILNSTRTLLQDTVGAKNSSLATNSNNIGEVNRKKGDYNSAITHFETAIALYSGTLGPYHPNVATTLNNIGETYRQKGDLDSALEYFNKSLAIRQNNFGTKHASIATSYNNIGGVYANREVFDKAIEFYQKALEIRTELLGNNHPSVATTFNNLGAALSQSGNDTAAMPYFEKSLVIRLQTVGESHPDTATSYFNLGSIYERQGDIKRAVDNYRLTMTIREDALGREHPDTLLAKLSLAAMYHLQGNYSAAADLYRRFIAGEEPGRPMDGLAGGLGKSVDHKTAALNCLTAVVEILTTKYGGDHVTTRKYKRTLQSISEVSAVPALSEPSATPPKAVSAKPQREMTKRVVVTPSFQKQQSNPATSNTNSTRPPRDMANSAAKEVTPAPHRKMSKELSLPSVSVTQSTTPTSFRKQQTGPATATRDVSPGVHRKMSKELSLPSVSVTASTTPTSFRKAKSNPIDEEKSPSQQRRVSKEGQSIATESTTPVAFRKQQSSPASQSKEEE